MIEYPKVITVGNLSVTVFDAAEEARWRTPAAPPAVDVEAAASAPMEPAMTADAADPTTEHATVPDPLEDVTVQMDNPDFAKPQTNALYDIDTDTTKRKKPAKKS